MNNWTLRRAEADDAPAMTDLVADAYRHYITRMGREPGPMVDDHAAQIRNDIVWLAEVGGRLTGALVLMRREDHLLLDNIAVHPDVQGQGLGRALLELADQQAREMAYREIRLYTNIKMVENLALYRKIGWREYHRGQESGFDRVDMKKSL